MELSVKQKETEEVLGHVITMVWEDESLKKELIASPIATIEKLTGKKLELKEGAKMVVVDESEPNTFYFNLPEKPDLENVELSEKQLDMVAGGGPIGAYYYYQETGDIKGTIISFFL